MITSSPCCQFTGRHLELRGKLERVDNAEHLVEIAAGGHRIDENELDLLVGPDDEDVAHRLIIGRRALCGVAIGGRRQHAPGLRDAQVRIADHRIVRRKALSVLNVISPLRMLVDGVDRKPDDFHVPAVELGLELGHIAELGGAHPWAH